MTIKKKLTKKQLVDRFIDQAATKLHGPDWRLLFTQRQVNSQLRKEIRQSVLAKAQRDARTAMSYACANRYYCEQIKHVI